MTTKHKIKFYRKDSKGTVTTKIIEYPAPNYQTAIARAKTYIGLGGIYEVEGAEK